MPSGSQKVGPPGVGIASGCESPVMGTGIQTLGPL